MKTIFHIIAISLLFAACSQNEYLPSVPQGENAGAVALAVSRADGDANTTYRVMLFNKVGTFTGYQGSYRYDAANNATNPAGLLTPWKVYESGAPDGDSKDVDAALYAPSGSYYMVIASPAVMLTKVEASGRVRYGMKYNRKPIADVQPLSVSDTLAVTLEGRNEVITTGNTSIYYDTLHIANREGMTLRERRSKINFVVRCGEKIPSATVTDVSLTNLIASACLDPVSNTFFPITADMSDVIESVNLFTGSKVLPNDGTEQLTLPATNAGEDDNGSLYILSQDYSATDETGAPIHSLPRLSITLGTEAEVSIPLGFNFQPLHSYTYTITINSVFVSVSLTVAGWDDKPIIDGTVDVPPTITIGTFNIASWDNGGTSNSTISSTTN